ncbi:MAG TPA: hypothetical protein VMZ92_02905 [Planctomycetota bacterium]|nr:hypothetical protein [Planctomycetota bacterium]
MPSNVRHQERTPPGTAVPRVLCVLAGSLLAVGTLGCANAAPFRGVDWTREKSTPFVELTPVAQTNVQGCGYASLGAVAIYHGVAPERLREEAIVRNFANRTLSAVDLVTMANALGLIAFGYQGTEEDLRENVTKGRPMLVLLSNRPRIGKFPSLDWSRDTAHALVGGAHWVVVVSTTPEGEFVLHDPSQGCLAMTPRAFLTSWKEEEMVCVLVSRPPKPAP